MLKSLMIAALFLITASLVHAQTIEVSGQLRERSEFSDRSFIEAAHPDVFHLLRARLGAKATINERVNVVVEVQDARTFGSSGSTLNQGSPAFDLRQGFVEVTGCADGYVSFKLGRQVLSYANERLLGGIDWSNFGQSFDAGVLRLHLGDVRVDALGAAIVRNSINIDYVRDVFLAGLWGNWTPKDSRSSVNAFWLFDTPATSLVRQNRHTAGVVAGGHVGMLDYEIEGAMQFGDHIMTGMESHHISANMIGARVGYRFPDLAGLRIGAGLDRLSGNDPEKTDTYGAFNTLYGTNHKYYGFMDYFTNIPASTSNLGLMDIIAQISVVPAKDVVLGVDVHLFSTVTDPVKALPTRDPEWSSSIGTEIDVTAKWKLAEVVGMTAGFSMFSANADRPVLRAIGTMTESTTWGYLMTTVNF
jgi:hypothetical protein